MNTIGRDRVGSLLPLRSTHLVNWQLRLTMPLRGGIGRIYMNSSSVTALASEWQMQSWMSKSLLSTSESSSCLVSSRGSNSCMSSTSVMIGPIYAQRASRRSIHLNLSVLFPIDLSHTSVGVQSRTSTAGNGVLTMARLRHRQTLGLQTFHRFERAGDLAVEKAVENSSPAVFSQYDLDRADVYRRASPTLRRGPSRMRRRFALRNPRPHHDCEYEARPIPLIERALASAAAAGQTIAGQQRSPPLIATPGARPLSSSDAQTKSAGSHRSRSLCLG